MRLKKKNNLSKQLKVARSDNNHMDNNANVEALHRQIKKINIKKSYPVAQHLVRVRNILPRQQRSKHLR